MSTTVSSPAEIHDIAVTATHYSATVLPVIKDVSTLPLKPMQPSPELPFSPPRPKVLTDNRCAVRIIRARRKMVVLDSDLAELCGSSVCAINKAVLRNACCFPRSICFRLSNDEWHHLKHRTNVGEVERGDWLCAPLVFTEEGTLVVSKILTTFEAIRGHVIVWQTIQALLGKTAGRITA